MQFGDGKNAARNRRGCGSPSIRVDPSDLAARKPAMKDSQKSARSTTATATAKTSKGFTDQERAAIKARAQEV
jgi:hypothetical protein